MIRVEPFLELMFQSIDKVVIDMSNEKRRRTMLAARRLRDNMLRLQDRYIALLITEEGPPASLSNWQYEFVDKTEAFHQQVYSTISTLIHVLNYVGIREVNSQHPFRSVQKFLGFLSELPQFNDTFRESVDIVLKSVRFRAEYIDHPQGLPPYDWMTCTYDGTSYLIYYAPKSDMRMVSAFDIKNSDPTSPDFSPPIACSQFCVSPLPDRIFQGIIAVVSVLLYRE